MDYVGGALQMLEDVGEPSLFQYNGSPTRLRTRSVGRSATMQVTPCERADETQYTVRLEKIGYHMYYGGDGAYLYQPIPKCACTTIKTLLLQVEGLPVDANVWRRHQKEYNSFPGTRHLTIRDQLDIFEGRTDTFKFVFVRNPYARLASAYCDKILLNPAAYLIRKIRKSAAELGTVLSDPITFEQFVSVVSRQSLEEMDPHCRPQYYEGRFAIVKYDFIGRVEAMPGDLVYAFERIGAPESIISRVNERYNVAGSSFDLWDTVPSEVQRLFLATFEIDFDTLQYPRRLPRAPSSDDP
jgi:dermatan 4-sulfotransferase 1